MTVQNPRLTYIILYTMNIPLPIFSSHIRSLFNILGLWLFPHLILGGNAYNINASYIVQLIRSNFIFTFIYLFIVSGRNPRYFCKLIGCVSGQFFTIFDHGGYGIINRHKHSQNFLNESIERYHDFHNYFD